MSAYLSVCSRSDTLTLIHAPMTICDMGVVRNWVGQAQDLILEAQCSKLETQVSILELNSH